MSEESPTEGGYTVDDFEESLGRVPLRIAEIEAVEAAYGEHGGWAEWSGGFLLRMSGGRWYWHLSGWCATSGWGCRDGVALVGAPDEFELDPSFPYEKADRYPTDLNRWLAEQKLKSGEE